MNHHKLQINIPYTLKLHVLMRSVMVTGSPPNGLMVGLRFRVLPGKTFLVYRLSLVEIVEIRLHAGREKFGFLHLNCL